jgi:cytidylate kinase
MRHVIIAGLTASGKTTQSKQLERALNLQYVSGSEIRSKLLGLGNPLEKNPEFWRDSEDGALFDYARLSGLREQDMSVDKELIEIARNAENCVFDAWVMPWLFQEESLCVLLKSSLNTRARRLVRSGHGSFDHMLRKVDEKDQRSRAFFLMAYRIDIYQDLSPFDVIIECDEEDDEATQSLADISDQLSRIVRAVLFGDHTGLHQVVYSLSNHSRVVKTSVRPRLFDRMAESINA